MAILNGIVSKMKGSAGNLTFKQRNGFTVVSEKMTSMSNPHTPSQMATRTRFTNIVSMYRGIRPLLLSGFETKPAGVSDYNMFVKVNEATGIPYCQFKANAVILDAANDAKLWEHVPKNGFSTVDGCIGHSGNDGDCVFAWVHSRKSNGKTLVSPQQLINANSKLAEYQSDAAFLLAANSYGVGDGAFLTPSGESVSSAGAGGNSSSQGGGGGDSL